MTDLAPLSAVTNVRVLSQHVVELTFGHDGQRVIDLEPLLWGPMFESPVTDYDLFRQVTVDPNAGTIVWQNGADISPRTLFAESRAAAPTRSPQDERPL